MSLPKWNNEWDPPDQLRGKLGWSSRHDANAALVVGVLAVVALLVAPGTLPALVRHTRKEVEMERTFERVQQAVAEGAVGTFQKR